MFLKKAICFMMILSALLLAACGAGGGAAEGVDVDLSRLGGAVVYGKVYDMLTNGEKYEGQTVRMSGYLNQIVEKQKGVVVNEFYSCFISDAEGCCSQGIEFVLEEGGEYPPLGSPVTVEGVWNNYTFYGIRRCRLLNAKLK